MLLQIFKPIESDVQTFAGNKLGDVPRVLRYEYHKKWRSPGSFTMELPIDAACAGMIGSDTLLYIDGDWLIARDISHDDKTYTIKGEDLKAYAAQRITLYSEVQADGTQGYDVVQGTTEYCVKHYINNNLVNPTDPYRRIPGMVIADNQGRGLAEDTYMARLQNVAGVLEELCSGAECGYDITADTENNRLVFDFAAPVDKTGTNIVRDRVVFAKKRGNVLSLARETVTANYKNAFYATKSTGTLAADAVTKLVLREGASTPGGPYRREHHVTVSPESVDQIDAYTRKEAENYRSADSFQVEPDAAGKYGSRYVLGDVVTVIDEATGLTEDKTITEARKEYAPGSRKVSLVLGDKKAKPLNVLNQKAEKAVYDIQNILTDTASNEEVRQSMEQQESQLERFNSLMAESCGLYQTVETDENGGKIYYFHDQPALADSTKIWKRNANGFAASNDSGQTWNSGHTVDGNVIAQMLIANKITSPTDPTVYIDLLQGIIAAKYLMDSTTSSKVQIGSDGTTSEGLFLYREDIFRMMLASQPYENARTGFRNWLLSKDSLWIQAGDDADGIPLRITMHRYPDGTGKIGFEADGEERCKITKDGYNGWVTSDNLHANEIKSPGELFKIQFDEENAICRFLIRRADGNYHAAATITDAGFVPVEFTE